MDILEIDAASNNGVDEIRDLRDKVRFPPSIGKYKVYIIDEVHMLSTGAFNALLKTLEEPPSHVVFILATTEPHKLPATILSRCQRFDFKRISQKVLVSRMETICSNMNITVDKEGLHTIARWAEGGMRDALSLLDQIISFSGSHITNNDILNILGTADQGFLFQTVDDILSGDLQGVLHKIGQLLDEGKALNVFTRDLLQHIRNLLIVKACEHPDTLLDIAESTLEQLIEQVGRAREIRLIRAIEVLSPLESEMRRSTQPRILLELAVVKLCRPEQEISLEALEDRMELLEKQVKSGEAVVSTEPRSITEEYDAPYAAAVDQSYHPAMDQSQGPAKKQPDRYDMDPSMPPVPPEVEDSYLPEEEQFSSPRNHVSTNQGQPVRQTERATLPKKNVESHKSTIESSQRARSTNQPEKRKDTGKPTNEAAASTAGKATKDPIAAWHNILDIISRERPSIHVTLVDGKPRMGNNGVLTLIFPPSLGFHVMLIEQENNRKFLEDTVKKVIGQQVRIKCLLEDQMEEQATGTEEDYIVKKAIEVFGEDLVEIVEEK